jgi:tRNA(fMet)-specific endonuclease VapC
VIYLLDTDILNYVLKRDAIVVQRFEQALREGHGFVLSAVVDFEITRYHRLKGMHRVARFYASMVELWSRVEVEADDWRTAADLWASRHRAGKPITDSDLLIAVSALKSGATLATNNLRHFDDLGLSLETWTDR